MNSGRLRESVTVQQKTETVSDSGQVSMSWQTFATGFAEIKTISGKEQIQNGTIRADMTHRVFMRAFEVSGITADMRILWNDKGTNRTLNIVYIGEDRKHDRMAEMLCLESR